MNSRFFLPFTLVLAAMAAMVLGHPSPATAADANQPQYYELRVYSTKSDEQRQRVNDYWQNAAIPAYNRMGIQTVGVFTELADSVSNKVYVLVPCDSLEIYGGIPANLAADSAYQKAASEYLSTVKTNAAYERIESSLLVAFDGMKHLTLAPANQKPNLFELRTYMSPSEGKGLNKVQMFNSGEIPLMQSVGMAPVFYGRTLIGPKMPCLTYMLSADNPEAHKQHWQGFINSPIWKKMSADPQYQDNVSGIISITLKRMPASQI